MTLIPSCLRRFILTIHCTLVAIAPLSLGCSDSEIASYEETIPLGFEIQGRVTDHDAMPRPGVFIHLQSYNDAGEDVSVHGQEALTDEAGDFSFSVHTRLPPGFVLRAHLPEGPLYAPALCDGASVSIHPATTVLFNMLLQITREPHASWRDLDAAQVRALHDRSLAPEAIGNTDLADNEALESAVHAAVGDLVAQSFNGEVLAVASTSVTGPNNAGDGPDFTALADPVGGEPCNRRNYPLSAKDYSFDLLATGALCDGHSPRQRDAFDIAYELFLLGDAFLVGGDAFPAQGPTRFEDNNELVFGPAPTVQGLSVSRKVRVDKNANVARYLEVIHNPTTEELSVGLEIVGDLGSDDSTFLLVTEHDGARASLPDRYAATMETDGFDPTVGFVWDCGGSDTVDRVHLPPDLVGEFAYAWEGVSIAPDETAILVHFVVLTPIRDAVLVREILDSVAATPPLFGMSETELLGLRNCDLSATANVVGRAGSMAPRSVVTVTHLTSSWTGQVTTRASGAFDVFVPAAVAGDEMKLVSATGGERTVIVGP